jgi:hypothetical protein
MVSLLQVVWFIFIYTLTTMALVAQLDWRLSALVLVWITAFGLLARYLRAADTPLCTGECRSFGHADRKASDRQLLEHTDGQALRA